MSIIGHGVAHGGTFTNNKPGVAAAYATLKLLQERPVLDTIRERGRRLMIGGSTRSAACCRPTSSFPVAEETGLIRQIGRWVLRAACLQGQAWRDAGLPPIPVAVNLSAREFNDERLAFEIAQAVVDANFDAHLLELEITESLVMQDPDRAVETLGTAQVDGRAHLDRRLRHRPLVAGAAVKLPVDSLKIDGALIRDIATDPTTRRSPRR